MIGVLLAVVSMLDTYFNKLKDRKFVIIGGVIILLLSLQSYSLCPVYANPKAFYDYTTSVSPKSALAWYNKAIYLELEKKDYYGAMKCYDSTIAISPQDYISWFNKGRLLHQYLKRREEAIICYGKAADLKPDYFKAFNNKAIALKEIGRAADAMETLIKAKNINSNDHIAFNTIGTTFKLFGNFTEALSCYDKSIGLKQDYADAWFNKAKMMDENLKIYSESIKSYDMAILYTQGISRATAWYNKGTVYSKLKMFEKEVECYDSAIVYRPNHIGTWNNRGFALKDLGRTAESEECFRKAKEIKSKGLQ